MIILQIITPIKAIKNPDLAKQPVDTKGAKKKGVIPLRKLFVILFVLLVIQLVCSILLLITLI